MSAAIYFFLFSIILKVKTEHYSAYLITGVLTWNFFSVSISQGMSSILSSRPLLTKVKVNIAVFPLSTMFSNFFTLILSFPIIILSCVISDVPIGINSLFYFYFIFILSVIAYEIAFTLSNALIYIRDLQQVISPILQIWFYATPILYQASALPEKYKWVLFLNPIGMIFDGIHKTLLQNTLPSFENIFVPFVWLSITTAMAVTTSSKLSPNIIEKM